MINTGSSGGESNPPLYTLDVNGDIRVSDDLFVDDFASLDSCRIGTTQTDPGTGNLVVEGNVGIGTDTPGATLDVLGDTSSDQLRLGLNDTNYYKIGRNSSTGFLDFQGTQGGYTGYTFKNDDGSTDLTILDSGYVGIGTASPSSTFEVSGSQAGNYTVITGDMTLDETHYIADLATNATTTVTLPAASGVTGRTYHILSTGNGDDTLTIDSNGGQFMGSNQSEGPEDSIEIEGSAQSVTLVSTGTYWFILTDNRQQEH
jgi:hypothetical protein